PVELTDLAIDAQELRAFVEQSKRILDPAGTAELHLRARRYQARGKHTAALADLNRAAETNERLAATQGLKLGPAHAAILRDRALSRLALKEPAKARSDCDASLKLAPADAATWARRGAARDQLGDLAGADEDLTQAVQLDPQSAAAFNHRGTVRRRQNRADE